MWYLLLAGVALAACRDQPTKFDCRASSADPCYWCAFLGRCEVDTPANHKHCALAKTLTISGSVAAALIVLLALAVIVWCLYLRHCCRKVPERKTIVVERPRPTPVVRAEPSPAPVEIWRETRIYERMA